jgi:hypothetical protein
MKIKTISAFVLSASSAFALIGPHAMDHKTICLDTHEDKDGVLTSRSCDQSRNNRTQALKILANGCAEGQVSLIDSKEKTAKKFNFNIPNCLPPHVAQL